MLWPLMYAVPKNLLSRISGVMVRLRWPAPFKDKILLWFAERYHINMKEAERGLSGYATIQELFTRRLKPGARPIRDGHVVHPVDGELTVATAVLEGQLLQVKGWTYSLQDFLGENQNEKFEGGTQLTYYLCPTDYHRVHSPVDGAIVKVSYIPGQLWPVNNWSVLNIRSLFARNERVVVWIRTNKGDVALVMVGATNVGQMSLSFDQSLITNLGQPAVNKTYDPPLPIERGGEVGVFNMGSTVIMVYPPGFLIPFSRQVPRAVRLGQDN